MENTTCLFGMTLLLSAIAVNERVAALADEHRQFLGCVSGAEQGAMGVHLVNVALVDGKAEAHAPETLVTAVSAVADQTTARETASDGVNSARGDSRFDWCCGVAPGRGPGGYRSATHRVRPAVCCRMAHMQCWSHPCGRQ